MSDQVDRILATIDAGLQSTGEASYGENVDWLDAGPITCARCAHPLPDDSGDICLPCRAYLLGDTTTDPATSPVAVDLDAVDLDAVFRLFADFLTDFAQQIAAGLSPFMSWLSENPELVRELLNLDRER